MKPNVKVQCNDRKTRALIRKAVLHHKLDRRFVYTVCPDSYLSVACKFTTSCSGCAAMDGCWSRERPAAIQSNLGGWK